MKHQFISSYRVHADFAEIVTEVWRVEEEARAKEPPVDEQAVENLTTENARLVSLTARSFPEDPMYPAIMMVALIAALIDLLFLIR